MLRLNGKYEYNSSSSPELTAATKKHDFYYKNLTVRNNPDKFNKNIKSVI